MLDIKIGDYLFLKKEVANTSLIVGYLYQIAEVKPHCFTIQGYDFTQKIEFLNYEYSLYFEKHIPRRLNIRFNSDKSECICGSEATQQPGHSSWCPLS